MAYSSREVLPMLAVASMEVVYAATEISLKFQLYVDPMVTLSNAVIMNARVRAGDRTMGFEVYNPELLRRKVEAAAAVRDALAQMEMTAPSPSSDVQTGVALIFLRARSPPHQPANCRRM